MLFSQDGVHEGLVSFRQKIDLDCDHELEKALYGIVSSFTRVTLISKCRFVAAIMMVLKEAVQCPQDSSKVVTH
jgi:hypothetical protein